MLTDNDIGRLFSVFAAAYGNQWKLQDDAAEVWLRKLGGFAPQGVMDAASVAIDQYPKHPPTLGQFTAIVVGPRKPGNTYLPPPSSTKARSLINRILLKTLTDIGGVDNAQLKKLVNLKNALLEEVDQIHPPIEWANSAYEQLTALAMLFDREARAQETAFARQRLRP